VTGGIDALGIDLAGRFRDILRANTAVVERLDLEVVLRRVVESSMELVGARYGALGVIGTNGHLERFIHVGMPADAVDRIGHLPRGEGILGAVIEDARPIRLARVQDDPRSAGFPAGHPPMAAFLGVPIRVGAQVYGNLYLTDSSSGAFSQDDEDLVVALAATAGVAIENARLYDTARTREAWSATTADVMAAMLDVAEEDVLDVIAERVAELLEAHLVVVAVPYGERELRIETARGPDAASVRGRTYPLEGTLSEQALASRRAASVESQPEGERFEWQPSVGPTVAIPLLLGEEPLGVLSVSRGEDGSPFTDADLEMAFTFASQASIAIEIVRGRDDRFRLERTEDRARIARDLHDRVIQRLFAAGLYLQGISSTLPPETAAAVDEQIDMIDAAIRDIRTIVFALDTRPHQSLRGARARLLAVVSEASAPGGPTPRIVFSGPLDSVVPPDVAEDLAAVLRECLSNVVRHAHATHTDVEVSVHQGTVVLRVDDDGRGIPPVVDGSGLANIAERARLRGGRCDVGPRPGGGTRVEWHVPVSDGTRS